MLNETVDTLNDQAVRLANNGDYEDALVCFSRAIEIESDNALLWYNLGLTYRDNGQFTWARAALEKAHELDDEDEDTIETLAAVCISLRDLDEAKAWCTLGLSIEPVNAHLWNTFGAVLFNEGDYEEACEMFEKAVTLYPYYYEALYNLKDTYKELHNERGELECKKKLALLDKKNGNKKTAGIRM